MSTELILVLSMAGMIAALVAMRLTFRNAANVRDAVISPTVFAVCGALIAISIGMIWLSDSDGRVTIDKGMVRVVLGTCLGAWVGAGARNIYLRVDRGKIAAFLLVTTILAGSIGTTIGWLFGEVGGQNGWIVRPNDSQEEYRMIGMTWGLAIGSGIGVVFGLSEVVFHRRGAT